MRRGEGEAMRRKAVTSRRLQNGQAGEMAAQNWFINNGWEMIRTQPPVTILGMITPPLVAVLRQFIPRLAYFGHMVIARMGKGGAPDYTGFANFAPGFPIYRAVEVKEAAGDSMPASRLDKAQRDFMAALPGQCAWVGILWVDTGKFTMHEFREKGSYKRP